MVWRIIYGNSYTVQIENIFKFVENNPFTTWFKIHFKNYVIDKNHYITDFCPPRIFRTESIAEFFYDNDCLYYTDGGGKVSYLNFPSMTVPKNIAFVKHYTWLDNERSKQKCEYQEKHFAHGAGCSFKWENSHLTWNLEYFKKTGTSIPEIYQDE